jgi:pyruvate, orthophosphate dikinase
MRTVGLPVPAAFTIATDAWRAFRSSGGRFPETLRAELAEAMVGLEVTVGRGFGAAEEPLLVSVRSGAPIPMPGMMDSVLNVGLSRQAAVAMARGTGDDHGWRLYARLLRAFAATVRGISDAALTEHLASDASASERALVLEALIAEHGEREFPQAATGQLIEAIEGVWRSWDGRRAQRYRMHAGIDEDLGTAVTVQAMVFGDLDEQSGSGVVFTRDPATGSPYACGEFVVGAQGDGLLSADRTPATSTAMRRRMPRAYADLESALPLLEAVYRDMCDVAFTVEASQLWILQAEPGERTSAAAVRIAVDLVDEGLIEVDEALDRIPLAAMNELQTPVFARDQTLDVLARGIGAVPGAAVGHATFDSDRASHLAAEGKDVILLRGETSTEDVDAITAARGVVTARGGSTSHAALVARRFGRPAVCGVQDLEVQADRSQARIGDRMLVEGDTLALDGQTGIVALGSPRLVPAQPGPRSARILRWCDERRRVPISPVAPAGYERVGTPEAAEALHPLRAMVEVEWQGPHSANLLEQTVAAALECGAEALALKLPALPHQGDLNPRPGPWTALVASRDAWAARLLATRLRYDDGSDRTIVDVDREGTRHGST